MCPYWLIVSSPYTTPGSHVSLLTDCLIPIYHTWYSRVLTDWLSHSHIPHLVFMCPYWLIVSSPYTTPGIHVSLLTDCLIPIYHTWYSRVLTDWLSHPHIPHLVFTCPYWLIVSDPYTTPGIHVSLLTDCLIPIYHTWYSCVLTDWLSHSHIPHLVVTCPYWLIVSFPYTTPGIHVSLLTDCLIPIYHTWYSCVLTDWLSHPHIPHLVFTCPYWLIVSSPYTTPGSHVSLLTDYLIPIYHTWYSHVLTDWLSHLIYHTWYSRVFNDGLSHSHIPHMWLPGVVYGNETIRQ